MPVAMKGMSSSRGGRGVGIFTGIWTEFLGKEGNGTWEWEMGKGGFFACILEMFPAEPEMLLLLLPLCGAPPLLSPFARGGAGGLSLRRALLSIHPSHPSYLSSPSRPSSV